MINYKKKIDPTIEPRRTPEILSLKIINEITNELSKTINKMVGIFQVRILWVAIFQGEVFQGGV